MNRSYGSSVFWLRVRGVAVVGALVLAGCSSSGGDDTSSEPRKTDTTASTDDESVATDVEVDEEDDVAQPIVAGEPVSHLPFDADAPDGYRMITGECKANAEALAALEAAGEYDYQSPITFAVPEDWISRGKGSGGSGGVTGTDVDFRYESPNSGEVTIGFEWDDRGPGGEIYDGSEPWESFDSEITSEDVTTVIEYEQVATVSIQDQTVELFYLDPSQASDLVDGEKYKARVSAFDLPGSLSNSGVDEYSLVFTVYFDEDTAEIDQDVVEAIIGSINLPTCVWDDLLLSEEVFRQTDLNGDGQVKSMEEWQAEFQKEMDDLAATVDD